MDSHVRVVAAGTAPGKRTVNIVTSLVGYNANEIQTCIQVTGAQAAAQPDVFETVQAAAVVTPGLKTIYIAGYTAPN
jgi:hypothetical protein